MNANRLARGVVRTLRALPRRPDLFLPALASLLVLSLGTRLMGEVHSIAGDDMSHLAAETQILGVLEEGGDPLGPLNLEFGTPLLRFYQPGFYTTSAVIQRLTGWPKLTTHNTLVVIAFALSPWAIMLGLRLMGLGRWAAGLTGLIAIGSVATFANSFEGYFRPGIITQSIGYLYFPIFLGLFWRLLSGKARPVLPAVLLALLMVNHAPLSVFVVLAGGVMFLCNAWPLRLIWKKLVVFAVLSASLVAFWAVPFVWSQERYRAIPDSVLRHNRTWWFTGMTADETARMLFTGRLFDDARTVVGEKVRHPLDKRMDQINMGSTRFVRFPLLTILILGGFAWALFHLRDHLYRFFATVFSLGMLIYIGSDEIPWLFHLPFAHRIQGFRSIVSFELYGFAMAAMALSDIGERLWRLRKGWGRWLRWSWATAFSAATVALIGYLAWHAYKPGDVAIKVWDHTAHHRLAVAAAPTLEGYPLRVQDEYGKSDNRRSPYQAQQGQQSVCSLFAALGPHTKFLLCRSFKPFASRHEVSRRLGFGYYLSAGKAAVRLGRVRDREGDKLLELVHEKDGHWLYRAPDAHFLQPLTRAALVVADFKQWTYVSRSWWKAMHQPGKDALLPVLAEERMLDDPALMKRFQKVLVLNPDAIDRERLVAALKPYVEGGGIVYSAQPLEGVEVEPMTGEGPSVKSLLTVTGFEDHPVEDEVANNRFIPGPYSGTVELSQPGWVMLPIHHSPGWIAEVDGEPVMTLPAGPDFVAAPIPAGEHRITFRWEHSPLERKAYAVSAAGWSFVLLYVLYVIWRGIKGWRKRWRPVPPPAHGGAGS